MPDMEKVISDIEQQIRWIEEIECHKFPGWLNVTNAMRDALALLKEQEPIKPKSKVRHGENGQIQHWCGNCMAMLHGKPKYCSNCGRQVKWE
jgi:hypothetical protein